MEGSRCIPRDKSYRNHLTGLRILNCLGIAEITGNEHRIELSKNASKDGMSRSHVEEKDPINGLIGQYY